MDKIEIRTKIKELAAHQKQHRSGTKGPERNSRWQSFMEHYRSELRRLYLAYALLRGVPYETIERRCHEQASPYAISQLVDKPEDEVTLWIKSTSLPVAI